MSGLAAYVAMRPNCQIRIALSMGLAGAWLSLGSLSATPTVQYNCGDPTGDEQYMLELINRARMGPWQEGTFLTDTDGVRHRQRLFVFQRQQTA